MQHFHTLFYIALTIAVYYTVRRLYLKYNNPLLNIVALSAAVIIALLVFWDVPYPKYDPAKNVMTLLLGPATVALALPLYRYRVILRQQAGAIVFCVALGSLLATLTAALICQLGGLPREVVMSMLPKGVSIPFALEISAMYGGIPPMAAAFVVATGTLGSLFGSWILNRCRIHDPIARGLAFGTVSHAQGTASALMEGEQQGAMGGLALILAGILTALFAPAMVSFLELFPSAGS